MEQENCVRLEKRVCETILDIFEKHLLEKVKPVEKVSTSSQTNDDKTFVTRTDAYSQTDLKWINGSATLMHEKGTTNSVENIWHVVEATFVSERYS